MDGKSSWFTKLNDWLVKQIEKMGFEYKLDLPAVDIGFIELKLAHSALMAGYASVLASISRLSFFTSSHEIYKTQRRPPIAKFLFYVLSKYSPFRLLVIRPLVSVFVESHIKSKLRELEVAYIQLKSSIPIYHDEREKRLGWLESATKECKEMSGTLSSWGIVWEFAKSTFNFLLATGAVAFLVNSTNQTLVIELLIILVFVVFYSLLFVEAAFRAKRDIFIGADEKGSIYVLENDLFECMKRGKRVETPYDHLFNLVPAFFVYIVFYAWNESTKALAQTNTSPGTFTINLAPSLAVVFTAYLLVKLGLPIIKRWKSKQM